eukprot:GHRQ01035130.1.p1 GENE.GHRQ01035130.1~~GHRQ01035130.1.p1  ORF type:complete len:227 (+),score=67.79 GHRQ01035130.1:1328-2008(+)
MLQPPTAAVQPTAVHCSAPGCTGESAAAAAEHTAPSSFPQPQLSSTGSCNQFSGSSSCSRLAPSNTLQPPQAYRRSCLVQAALTQQQHSSFIVAYIFHTIHLDKVTLNRVQVDQADVDIILVGDSVSMVVHGHDTTLPITLDDMMLHCKAVARGAARAFLVGDLPFGSYELSTTEAVRSAVRMLKEGGMDAVKLEGGCCDSISLSSVPKHSRAGQQRKLAHLAQSV